MVNKIVPNEKKYLFFEQNTYIFCQELSYILILTRMEAEFPVLKSISAVTLLLPLKTHRLSFGCC